MNKRIDDLLKKAKSVRPSKFDKVYIWYTDSHKSFAIGDMRGAEDNEFETWDELEAFVDNLKPRQEILFRKF